MFSKKLSILVIAVSTLFGEAAFADYDSMSAWVSNQTNYKMVQGDNGQWQWSMPEGAQCTIGADNNPLPAKSPAVFVAQGTPNCGVNGQELMLSSEYSVYDPQGNYLATCLFSLVGTIDAAPGGYSAWSNVSALSPYCNGPGKGNVMTAYQQRENVVVFEVGYMPSAKKK